MPATSSVRSTVAIVTFVLMSMPAAQARDGKASEGLCSAAETTVVACKMGPQPGARIAALCADEHASPWRLHYRFGTAGHVELTYPAAGEPAAFRHAIISYSALGGDAVLFDHGGATYALFYVLGHDTSFDGVSVRKGDTEVANLSCAEGSVDELTTDFFTGAALPRESGQFEVPEVFFTRYAARQRKGR